MVKIILVLGVKIILVMVAFVHHLVVALTCLVAVEIHVV